MVDVYPEVSHLFKDNSGGTDIIFDWHQIIIPQGACMIKSFSGTIHGIDGATGNDDDIRVYFAKGIDGKAPASFGTVHAASTATTSAPFRRNLLNHLQIDMSSMDNGDILVGYNIFGSRSAVAQDTVPDGAWNGIMLQGDTVPFLGDTNYIAPGPGFTSIWISASAVGAAVNFGTEVNLNMGVSANVAANMTGASVVLTTSDTDPRLVFQAGDKIIGETGGPKMVVVSVDGATQITVKNITEQIDHAEQLLLHTPISFRIGLEY